MLAASAHLLRLQGGLEGSRPPAGAQARRLAAHAACRTKGVVWRMRRGVVTVPVDEAS